MKKKRVLIVEDNQVEIKLFKKIVSQVSVKSHLVSSGNEAISYLKKHDDIGLVLLDLNLPDISGMDVLKDIKKLNSKIVVAILSATEDSNVALEATKLGAVEFFVKGKDPNDLMRLFEFIDNIINEDLKS